ncbi:hypothetical protein AgCh_001073 [Apium graveolens]
MSISLLRLRRATLSLSSLLRHNPISSLSSTPPLTPLNSSPIIPSLGSQFRAFRASTISFARPRNVYQNEPEIGPDDILFEGCDYNHWLITVDFPKDPRPSSEEMVDTYVKIAAMIFGTPEEAKKKIYACSTTTYQGFQVECSEEVSKKFEGLPGVVFVLPDSYIDPVNKQYGGDKYDNGIITPRPLPNQQYGRTGGRFGDRNRDSNRPFRPRGEFNQGNPLYDNRGNTQGSAGNFEPPRHPPPQQNYGPPRVAPVNSSSGGQEIYLGYGRDQLSPNQGNYNQGQRGNSYPQGPSVAPGNLTNNTPSPPQGGNIRPGAGENYDQGGNGGYGQGAAGSYGQGAPGRYGQGAAGSYGQGAPGSYGQGAPGSYGQGAPGSYGQGPPGSYGQGAGSYNQGAAGSYGQGVPGSYGQGGAGSYGQGAAGSYGQGGAPGNYGQGAAGNYGQGAGGHCGQGATGSFGQGPSGVVPGQEKLPNYGQPDSVHVEDQRFSQGQQMYDVRPVQK